MIDNILVGAIVLIAAVYIGRRLYNQFTAKSSGCGCSGCGQAGSCSGIQDTPGASHCDSAK